MFVLEPISKHPVYWHWIMDSNSLLSYSPNQWNWSNSMNMGSTNNVHNFSLSSRQIATCEFKLFYFFIQLKYICVWKKKWISFNIYLTDKYHHFDHLIFNPSISLHSIYCTFLDCVFNECIVKVIAIRSQLNMLVDQTRHKHLISFVLQALQEFHSLSYYQRTTIKNVCPQHEN